VIHADRKPTNGHKDCYIAATANKVALLVVEQQFKKKILLFKATIIDFNG